MTLDPAGNVVTAGSNFAAWTLTKLDGATGAPVWTTNISGTLSDSPQAVNGATAVTMDRNGDVIGVGFTTNAGTQAGSDFTLIKLSAETGTEMWRTVIDGGARPSSATLMVGPEGGWSAAEIEDAVRAGYVPVTLGRRTLRADAVAIVAIGVLQFLWGDL